MLGRKTLLDWYDLGAQVQDAAAYDGEIVYGAAVIPKLAEAWECDSNLLYACRRFAVIYRRAEVVQLIRQAEMNGHKFTLGHFCCLSTLSGNRANDRSRRRLERRVVTEGVSIRKLRQLVRNEWRKHDAG